MKKIIYPNEGHPVQDYYIDGINRVFEDNGNLIITLESISGIESHDSIYKNEIARLIIPISCAEKISNDLKLALEVIISNNKNTKRRDKKEPQECPEKIQLGAPFKI